MSTMTINELMDLQKRAHNTVKRRSYGGLSHEEKGKFIDALKRVADGTSVQAAATEVGVNKFALYAFVKGKKKLDLLVAA